MTRRSAAPLLALSLVCAACGPPLLRLPSGPGVIAADGREILDAATAACRPLSAVSLEIAVSGSIAGSRVRGRLLAGLTRDLVPLIRKIVNEAAKNDYKFSSIILGIVKSEPFQMNMRPAGEQLAAR